MSQPEFESRPESRSGIGSRHIVAIVVTALIYGTLVFISRFSPQIFGIQTIYPPAAVTASFGIWFGVWGSLGNALGNLVSAVLIGRNPLVWLIAYAAQFVASAVPGIFYRKTTIDNFKDLLRFQAYNLAGLILSTVMVAFQISINGTAPPEVAWTVIWPTMIASNVITGAILGPLIFRYVTPYVVKSGLFFRRFLG